MQRPFLLEYNISFSPAEPPVLFATPDDARALAGHLIYENPPWHRAVKWRKPCLCRQIIVTNASVPDPKRNHVAVAWLPSIKTRHELGNDTYPDAGHFAFHDLFVNSADAPKTYQAMTDQIAKVLSRIAADYEARRVEPGRGPEYVIAMRDRFFERQPSVVLPATEIYDNPGVPDGSSEYANNTPYDLAAYYADTRDYRI